MFYANATEHELNWCQMIALKLINSEVIMEGKTQKHWTKHISAAKQKTQQTAMARIHKP